MIKKISTMIVLMMFMLVPVSFADALSITNVNVDGVTDDSANITWETDENSTSVVVYGTDELNITETKDQYSSDHSVLLEGLDNGTEYSFDVMSSNTGGFVREDNNGNHYSFTTLNEDTSAPFIDVDMPRYVRSDNIDVLGSTEPGSIVHVYVNGEVSRMSRFENGIINFYRVYIDENKENTLRITAKDDHGNEEERTFTVISDTSAPSISLNDIPSISNKKAIVVSGSLSEKSNLSIYVDEKSIYEKDNVLSFSTTAAVEEGESTIRLVATDSSGLSSSEERKVYADFSPPEIFNVKPDAGSFFYEGRSEADIRGKTEPYSTVKLYFPMVEFAAFNYEFSEPEYETIADSEGNFKFDDIDLEDFSASVTVREIQPGEIVTPEKPKAQKQAMKALIVAEDRVGQRSEYQLRYMIGTCWSGDLDFRIDPMLEYQTPTLLSPRRIEEGTEIISFILDINYTGTDEARIRSVSIEKACEAGYEGDESYRLGCELLPNKWKVRRSNDANNLWYVRYDLNKNDKFSDLTKDVWNDLLRNEVTFPFKVVVSYEEGKGKELLPKQQTKCLALPYQVDVPIDPREVVPDSLLETGLDITNSTITTINDILEPLQDVIKYVGISCITSFITRFLTRAWRIWSCKIESHKALIYDKLQEKEGEAPTCPSSEKVRKALPYSEDSPWYSTSDDAWDLIYSQDKAYTSLKTDCPGCASAWEFEEKIYKAYRLTCDRIFCHTAPARWTETASQDDIQRAEYYAKSCNPDDVAGVTPLLKVENCYSVYGPDGKKVIPEKDPDERFDVCYKLGNKLYVLLNEEPTQVFEVSRQKPVSFSGGSRTVTENVEVYSLDRYDKKSGIIGGPVTSNIDVIKEEGSNTYATRIGDSCSDICRRFGKKGECVSESQCTKDVKFDPDGKAYSSFDPDDTSLENGFGGYLAGYTEDCWIEEDVFGTPPKQCCCYEEVEKGEPSKEDITDEKIEWEYREEILYRETSGSSRTKSTYGTYYPDDRYIENRDKYACFGQDHLFDYARPIGDKRVPIVSPFDSHIASLQCACLTGIRARLVLLRSIMQGLNNCFYQIRTTGEADAGVCKELFTQYVCDLVYQIYVWFKEGCIPMPFGGGIELEEKAPSFSSGVKIGLESIGEAVSTTESDLYAEYGETALGNYLEGGEKAIARKICLAAFGFDVGFDMDTVIDIAYDVPFKTSASAWLFRRDFLTYNPDNSLATYDYSGSWTIFPGCDIEDYNVDLVCVNQEEAAQYDGIDCSSVGNKEPDSNGCDCFYSNEPYSSRSQRFYVGRGEVKQGQYVDQDHHSKIESPYRYDHVKITLRLKEGWDSDKCFNEENREGDTAVFYAPITDKTARDIIDCSVDVLGGKFKCSQGLFWDSRGYASFMPFTEEECGGEECYALCKDPYGSGDYVNCKDIVYTPGKRPYVKVNLDVLGHQCIHYYFETGSGKRIPSTEPYFLFENLGRKDLSDLKNTEKRLMMSTPINKDDITGGGASIVSLDRDSRCEAYLSKKGDNSGVLKIRLDNAGNNSYSIVPLQGSLKFIDRDNVVKDVSVLQGTVTDLLSRTYIFEGNEFRFSKLEIGECSLSFSLGGSSGLWKFKAELLYPDNQGNCDDSAFEKINKVGTVADLSIPIEVKEEISGKCERLSLLYNSYESSERSVLLNKLEFESGEGNYDVLAQDIEAGRYSCLTSGYDTEKAVVLKQGQGIEGSSKLCKVGKCSMVSYVPKELIAVTYDEKTLENGAQMFQDSKLGIKKIDDNVRYVDIRLGNKYSADVELEKNSVVSLNVLNEGNDVDAGSYIMQVIPLDENMESLSSGISVQVMIDLK